MSALCVTSVEDCPRPTVDHRYPRLREFSVEVRVYVLFGISAPKMMLRCDRSITWGVGAMVE